MEKISSGKNLFFKKGTFWEKGNEQPYEIHNDSTVAAGILAETEQPFVWNVDIVKGVHAQRHSGLELDLVPLNPETLSLCDFTAALCSHLGSSCQEERRYKNVVKV